MNSKRIIITGPTSGIGKEIASRLAAEGAELILASRDLQRGEQTAEEISQQAAAAEPAVIPVDTSRPASIREFAREVERRYDHLDVLVNNAGVLSPERKTTADGVELTLATNVIGYYLMTQELLGILRTGAPARVVNVASTFAGNLDLDDLQFQSRPYDGMQAYAQSKACDRMLTWAFARRLADSGVTVNAIAPGLVTETRLYRDLPHGIRRQLEQQASRSTSEGADTAVWLAHAPELEGVSGRFYEQRNEQPCQFRDPDLTEMLWGRCQQITASEQRLRGTGRASSSQLRPRGSHGKLPVS
jgi:NAD(P)-dependent dehydrogenase (short-subunit alcohol dehydrogenase family)